VFDGWHVANERAYSYRLAALDAAEQTNEPQVAA
jgi:hypothetical protein